MDVKSLPKLLTRLIPLYLLGSSGFPRLNIGTRTATAHAVGNIPDCRIPLNTLKSVGIRKSLNSMKYSFSNLSTP